ncbi:lipopolysaccharide biosynthesis protein [Planotetraspora sp. GP83]|uniref:lipopolysaccharide biosynthesis protein n=1 Tax=Planotetraspora sp. GP83 TaxID=3156264 RepID=UPI00351982E8
MTDIVRPEDAPTDHEEGWRSTLRRRLPADLDDPLLRNAYALIVNAGISAALGVGYWMIATRFFRTEDVGQGQALISAMRMLAALTSFGFVGALTRFIPETSHRTRHFIGGVYLVGAVLGLIGTVIFLAVAGDEPNYRILSGWGPGLVFAAVVVVWSVATLQDVVLTALRKSAWVPIVNIAVSLLKVAAVAGCAVMLAGQGREVSWEVFLAWIVPVAIGILPVNYLVFRRLIPKHIIETAHRTPPSLRSIARFVFGDYFGSVFTLAATYLIPVMIATEVSKATYAYYGIATTVGGLLEVFAFTMATSLTVEGAFDPAALGAMCRRALQRSLLALTPIVALVLVAAPWVLSVFGEQFSEKGTTLLRLLALATLARAVVELYLGALRALGRSRSLLLIQAVRCVLAIGLTMVLLPRMGITGVGVAMLVTQILMATAIARNLHRICDGEPIEQVKMEAVTSAGAVGSPPAVQDEERPAVGGVASGRQAVRQLLETAGRTRRQATRGLVSLIRRPGTWLGPVITIEALVMYVIAMRAHPGALVGVDLYRMNGLGLISVMPPVSLAAIGLLILVFFDTLMRRRHRPLLLLLQILAILFTLHGAAILVEPLPRFPVAWTIAGFVDYIARTGDTLLSLDARFNWPGFSTFAAFLIRAAGVTDPATLMNWWPLISNVLYLLPLLAIARRMRADRRAKWLAILIFVVAQWVGQDYFSPQGLTYLFYLLFVAMLMTWFVKIDPSPSFWRKRWTLQPGELPARKSGRSDRIIVLFVMVLLFAATTAAHQITPFMMVGVLGGLVVFRRTRLSFLLPVLFAVLVAAYVNYMAVAYWSGHLSSMVGGVGQVGGNLTQNTTGRISSTDPDRLIVLYTRLGVTAVMLGLAGLGFLRRLRRGIGDRVILVMLLVPVMSLAMLSYGGELGLRVYLFTLPATSLLVAYLFFPDLPSRTAGGKAALKAAALTAGARSARSRLRSILLGLRPVAACVCVLALAGAFLLARFGNEKYEWTSPLERAAVDYVYAQKLPTTRVLYLVADGPGGSSIAWSVKGVERVRQVRTPTSRNPDDVKAVIDQLRDAGPGSFLLATRSQDASLQIDANYPADWGPRIRAALSRSPELRTVLWNDDAAVFTLKNPPKGKFPPALEALPFRVGSTPATPYGVAALALLVIVVLSREMIRILQPRGAWWWSRKLALASLPLLIIVAGVVLERFSVLAGGG